MHYKINLKERFESKRNKLAKEGYKSINDWTEIVLKNEYSQEDEDFIINSKLTGLTDKEIASALNRSYWGVFDKIRRLKFQHNYNAIHQYTLFSKYNYPYLYQH